MNELHVVKQSTEAMNQGRPWGVIIVACLLKLS